MEIAYRKRLGKGEERGASLEAACFSFVHKEEIPPVNRIPSHGQTINQFSILFSSERRPKTTGLRAREPDPLRLPARAPRTKLDIAEKFGNGVECFGNQDKVPCLPPPAWPIRRPPHSTRRLSGPVPTFSREFSRCDCYCKKLSWPGAVPPDSLPCCA